MKYLRWPGIGRFPLFVMMLFLSAPALGVELVLPENLFFYNPVASVWGQPSLWTNPAAISPRDPGQSIIFTHRDGRIVQDWALASSLKTFGSAYRHIKYDGLEDLDEWLLAMGGGRRLSFGLSYRYMKNGPGYLKRRHLWTIGLLSRHKRDFSIGMRIENLNRGRIDGERTEVRYVFGVAQRLYNDKITLSFDADMTGKKSLRNADYRTGLEVRPVPGLYLYGNFDNHSQVSVGLRANIGSYHAGHYHSFDRDGNTSLSTSYFGSTRGRQASLVKLKPKKLFLQLDGSLPENPDIPRFQQKPLRFFDFVDGIYRAAEDDAIDGMFIHIGTLECGMGRVEELSEAIRYFRDKDKKVIIYLSNPTNLGYLLASAADSIIIPPVSGLFLVGLRAELRTYKGLMNKIGIDAEIERIAEYKTAPEMWLFEEPSQPYRREVDHLLDILFNDLVERVASGRNLPVDSVKALIDRAPLTSIEAVEAGLVDSRMYRDEASREFVSPATFFGGGEISLADYLQAPNADDKWGVPDRIALIIAEGDITGTGRDARIGGHDMIEAIRNARDADNVKGVILRINSPGGSALAADHIWHELAVTAEMKPLVISLGNVAASGGYYITATTGTIYTNRSTITGSIGVYAGKVNLSEFFDKAGIYSETHYRGENAAMLSYTEPFTEKQREHLRSQLKKFYDHFTSTVAQARSLAQDSVDAIGRGRTWTGEEAVECGLADCFGGVYRALEDICHELNLSTSDVEIVSYPQKYYLFRNPFDLSRPWEQLFRWISAGESSGLAAGADETSFIYFRMPYNIEIK